MNEDQTQKPVSDEEVVREELLYMFDRMYETLKHLSTVNSAAALIVFAIQGDPNEPLTVSSVIALGSFGLGLFLAVTGVFMLTFNSRLYFVGSVWRFVALTMGSFFGFCLGLGLTIGQALG